MSYEKLDVNARKDFIMKDTNSMKLKFSCEDTLCIDIDECALDNNICDDNEICHNTIGSFECIDVSRLLTLRV